MLQNQEIAYKLFFRAVSEILLKKVPGKAPVLLKAGRFVF
jgi:hypothetical protein